MIAGGAVVGTVGSALVAAMYYGFLGVVTVSAVLRAGLSCGLITSAFVIAGTVWFARTLRARKGWVIALSAVAPAAGWTLFGVYFGVRGDWSFFVAYPVVGVAAGIAAGIIAALGSFLVVDADSDSATQTSQNGDDDADMARLLFRVDDELGNAPTRNSTDREE